MPAVEDDRAMMFFRCLCGGSGNADLFMAQLHYYFRLERIRCFIVSSIGFYISPEIGKFDIVDFQNFYIADSGENRLRCTIYPINVLEPILWLAQNASRID